MLLNIYNKYNIHFNFNSDHLLIHYFYNKVQADYFIYRKLFLNV